LKPAAGAAAGVTAEELARAVEAYLVAHPAATVVEDGKALFSMTQATYALNVQGAGEPGTAKQGRCVLQLWSEERNVVRRVTGMRERKESLVLETLRLGQTKPGMLELTDARERRSPTERRLARDRYVKTLERAVVRQFVEWKPSALKTSQDLKNSLGPQYVRGELVRGNSTLALLAVGAQETRETIEGALTAGVLWLEVLRERAGKKIVGGLRLILPAGETALAAARMAWLDAGQAKWELYELDEEHEELRAIAAADSGNLMPRVLHVVDERAARDRFATEIAQIESMMPGAEIQVRSGTEIAFSLHGLVFARAVINVAAGSFERAQRLVFGAGASETELTGQSGPKLRAMLEKLRAARVPDGKGSNPLYRMQPEAWLESRLRADIQALDGDLERGPVYSQAAVFAGAGDRGMLDLLAVTRGGRLAVVELKVEEDMHLALQGLDYWMRVRHQHLSGEKSEFERMGYFPGRMLAREEPQLYLVAPALRVHSATETVLRYFSPRVKWTLVALDERWRKELRVVWRKRSGERVISPVIS
jgi:hypothetical protein